MATYSYANHITICTFHSFVFRCLEFLTFFRRFLFLDEDTHATQCRMENEIDANITDIVSCIIQMGLNKVLVSYSVEPLPSPDASPKM